MVIHGSKNSVNFGAQMVAQTWDGAESKQRDIGAYSQERTACRVRMFHFEVDHSDTSGTRSREIRSIARVQVAQSPLGVFVGA